MPTLMNLKIATATFAVLALALGTALNTAGAADSELEKIDSTISQNLKNIIDLATNHPGEFDSLKKANDKLLAYLKQVCRNKKMLAAPLKQAVDNGLTVATAPDKKVRYYTWDTQTGGTMHFFAAVVQYEGNNRIVCEDLNERKSIGDAEGDPGFRYSKVDQVNTKDKPVYLVFYEGIYSGKDRSFAIEANSIIEDKLKPTPFFYTKTKQLNSISYTVSSAEYNPESELIRLTNKGQTLQIPVITTDGQPTGKFLTYHFDGTKFVFGKGR